MFSIGRFSRLAGVSAKALRAYDALGLFRPAWVDPSSSYRYYSPAQLPDLRRILALRDMGLGLVEIRGIVAGGDLRTALERRREDLERERGEIDRRLRALDIRVDMAAETSDRPDVVIRPIAAETVASMALDDEEDEGVAFYELEAYVRDLGRRAQRPPGALLSPGSSDGQEVAEIFVPVTGPVAPRGRIGCRRLPAVRAATILERGPYDRLAAARGTLEGWLAGTGLRSAGPLRVLYLQFGAEAELALPPGYVVERPTDYLTELQLPLAEPAARPRR
jgi:DNA-binding transcriptional MerR regulator